MDYLTYWLRHRHGRQRVDFKQTFAIFSSGIFHPESNIDQHDASRFQAPYVSCVSVRWTCFLRQLSDDLVDALIASAFPSSP